MKEKILVDCPYCSGIGEIGGDIDVAPIDCSICGGTGQIWDWPEDEEYEPEND